MYIYGIQFEYSIPYRKLAQVGFKSTTCAHGLTTVRPLIYIYINLLVNAIVRLSHPQNGDSQGQETFLAPPADKQTCNYDTECSNHHPSL